MRVSGNIILPPQSKIDDASCLKLEVTDTIQCNLEEVGCDRKVFYQNIIPNVVINQGKVLYLLEINPGSNNLFEISGAINNGWCGDGIKDGDYFTDVTHYIEKSKGDVVKNIKLMQYGKKERSKFLKRYKVRQKYANILRHIQIINDVSDVLHLSSGYKSG